MAIGDVRLSAEWVNPDGSWTAEGMQRRGERDAAIRSALRKSRTTAVVAIPLAIIFGFVCVLAFRDESVLTGCVLAGLALFALVGGIGSVTNGRNEFDRDTAAARAQDNRLVAIATDPSARRVARAKDIGAMAFGGVLLVGEQAFKLATGDLGARWDVVDGFSGD